MFSFFFYIGNWAVNNAVSITRFGFTALLLFFLLVNADLTQANERCKRHFYADSSTVNQFNDRGQTPLRKELGIADITFSIVSVES